MSTSILRVQAVLPTCACKLYHIFSWSSGLGLECLDGDSFSADGGLNTGEALLHLLFEVQRLADHIEGIGDASGAGDDDGAKIQ